MNWKRLRTKIWHDWAKPILLAVLVLTSFRSAVADWNDVPTGSMKPTILEGDRIFVNKLAYDLRVPFTGWSLIELGQPARGDVVVLTSPQDGRRLVKRIVGMPGDTLSLRDGRPVVDGNAVPSGPLPPQALRGSTLSDWVSYRLASETLGEHVHPMMLRRGGAERRTFGPVVIPPGNYFVMGDNRDESFDSRWFGLVSRSAIQGRAVAVAVSVDPERSYWPRWDRFFTGLP